MTPNSDDLRYMQYALRLANRGLGQTWPNPSVGCVLVKDGQVIGTGRSAKAGGPHAETQALAQAGNRAEGATAYVTLEPCSHHGKTPPCANALVEAGIARVVIATADPDERVNGEGIRVLQHAGIEVTQGVCQAEAQHQHAGFFLRVKENRPFVTLKIATSADGMIAKEAGKPTAITGDIARRHTHLLRARHDAVLTGIGTVLADDPLLTCRLEGLETRSPVRVVLDSNLRLSKDCQLVQTANTVPLWVLTTKDGALGNADVTTLPELSIPAVLHHLAKQGITRLMVEGGAKINQNFLQGGLVDELHWYKAPENIGADGLKVFEGELPEALKHKQTQKLGNDSLCIYTRKKE